LVPRAAGRLVRPESSTMTDEDSRQPMGMTTQPLRPPHPWHFICALLNFGFFAPGW